MDTEERKRKSLLIPVILIITIPLMGFMVYFLHMANYYETHFLTNSIINGCNYSQCTVDQVESSLEKEAQDFSVTLYERNNITETIHASDIGYHYVSNGTVQNILDRQNPYLWLGLSHVPSNFNVMVKMDYDENLLKKCFDSLICNRQSLRIEPENAYIEYTENGRFEIIPEVMGNAIDKEKLYNKIKAAIEANSPSIDLEKEGIYINPKVTSDSKKLKSFTKKLNKLTRAKITYDFGDRKEILDRNTLKDWLIINKKKKTARLDESRAAEYVKSLADKYDTYGKPRKFTMHNGKSIEIEGGNYGWLINQEAEAGELLSLIKKGRRLKRTPEYIYTAISRKASDIGKTYVEVDLTSQHLWYYIKGKLFFETDLVSGDVLRGRETPTGTYTILYCQRNAVLVGPGYRTPVSYWMPFFNGCGLHDASWRWSFGGEIYVSNGSHGCLNLPLSAAASIFENMEAGTPIVLYKGNEKNK